MPDLRLIGYWRSEREPHWPRVEDFVDDAWDRRLREDLADYLRGGMFVRVYMGISMCRICGAANGSQEQSDGTFLWPEGLAHYVQEHAVRLPNEFVHHVRRRQHEFDEAEVDRNWWQGQSRP